MTAFVNGQPVANISLSNTWNEWVSMTNQLILDGLKETDNVTNNMVSSSHVLEYVSRETLGMANTDSPNFGGVIIDWARLAGVDQTVGTTDPFTANVGTFNGNVAIGSSDVSKARLYIAPSGVSYLVIGSNNIVVGSDERIYDTGGNTAVLLSTTNNFIMGKFGAGISTPNNHLEITGSFDTSDTLTDGGSRIFSSNNKPSKSQIGLGNVPNVTQVPKTGGEFSGNVNIQGTTTIENLIIFGNSLKEGNTAISYDLVSFDFSNENNQDTDDIAFNNDGSKMYMISSNSDSIYQYSLSTEFDLSTASYDSVSFNVFSEDSISTVLAFNDDGSKMYTIGSATDTLYQYTLSIPFDLSTASYDTVSFDLSNEDTNPTGLAFNNDGSKMYITGNNTRSIYQYTLSTPFDISTASYDTVSFSISSEDTNPAKISFNDDGSKLYLAGNSTALIHEYILSTPFDLSTISYSGTSLDVGDEDFNVYSVVFNNPKLFMLGNSTNSAYQYSVYKRAMT